MTEGRGYERLKPLTDLAEILKVATEFERTARDFYTDLVPKVSKNIRYLVEELAAEEQEHFELFSKLAEALTRVQADFPQQPAGNIVQYCHIISLLLKLYKNTTVKKSQNTINNTISRIIPTI